MGLERYAAAFRDNDIDNAVLQRLTAEDLRELGIASVGHRRRLLDAIAALALTPAVNASGLPAKTISLWCSGDCRRQPSPASWFRLTPLYDVMSAQPNVDAGEIRRNALPPVGKPATSGSSTELLHLSADEATAVRLSLRVALWAMTASLMPGILVALILARGRFWGKSFVDGWFICRSSCRRW